MTTEDSKPSKRSSILRRPATKGDIWGVSCKKTKKYSIFSYHYEQKCIFQKTKNRRCIYIFRGYKTDQIKEIAILNGLNVEYCKPRSPEYIRYGRFTMKVMNIKSQIFHFDPKHLDI